MIRNPIDRRRVRGSLVLAAAALLGTAPAASGQQIRGVVTAGGEPVRSAHLTLAGTDLETLTDAAGTYRFSGLSPGRHTVRVVMIGYRAAERTVTVAEGEIVRLDIELESTPVAMDPVVVTGTMTRSTVSESPVKVDVVPAAVLQRNATNNLMDAVQYLNGLYQQIDCGVCYTNNIRINGMEGPYTAVLIDGAPIMSALASVYGFNGINPSLIERIEIVKGPSSTLYGTEAMAGVVNIITKDPRFAPRLTVNAYRTSPGETSLDFSTVARPAGLDALFSGSIAHMGRFVDENGDAFSDLPLFTRSSLFGKVTHEEDGDEVLAISGKYYYEDRFGGVEPWTKADRGSASVYGESIATNRFELLGRYSPPLLERRLRLDVSLSWHDQDSYYGDERYAAMQRVLFGNLIWAGEAGERHDLLIGLSGRHQTYDDNTPATTSADRRWIPGIFAQDEWRASRDVVVLAGARLDHHAEHGAIFSPRLSLKWRPLPQTTLRVNGGTGFRVVQLFTEDHAALTGARDVLIVDRLEPERSRSIAVNVNQVLEFGPHPMMIDLDAFHTRFGNKIIPDYDRDPDLIVYDNLDGYSVSRGVALSLNQNIAFDRLLYRLGVTVQDVYTVDGGDRERETFAPEYTAVAGLSYNHPRPAVSLDYSARLTGPMRLPEFPEPFRRPVRSRPYSVHDVRLSWKLESGAEVFGAVRNLFDFTQGSPLVAAHEPFSDEFDTVYVWGPIHGRSLLVGLRYALGR